MKPWGTRTIKQRFDAAYIPVTESGCWLWMRGTYGWGYGKMCANGTEVPAHRLSYQLFKGDIPQGLFVLHRCDVPSCVNPDHLFLGTPKDNMQDMKAKGRGKFFVGEKNKSAIFSDDQIKSIRADARPIRVIAKEYGTGHGYISQIKSFKVRKCEAYKP